VELQKKSLKKWDEGKVLLILREIFWDFAPKRSCQIKGKIHSTSSEFGSLSIFL